MKLRKAILNFFTVLARNFEPIIHNVKIVINEEDNGRSLADFTKVEFHRALLDMNPDKSPGPDDFNPPFY